MSRNPVCGKPSQVSLICFGGARMLYLPTNDFWKIPCCNLTQARLAHFRFSFRCPGVELGSTGTLTCARIRSCCLLPCSCSSYCSPFASPLGSTTFTCMARAALADCWCMRELSRGPPEPRHRNRRPCSQDARPQSKISVDLCGLNSYYISHREPNMSEKQWMPTATTSMPCKHCALDCPAFESIRCI